LRGLEFDYARENECEWNFQPGLRRGAFVPRFGEEAKMRKLSAAGISHQFRSLEDSVRDYVGRYLQATE
jgi:hypothetical protein